MDNIFEIKNLDVIFSVHEGDLIAVDKLNLNVERGKVLGLVGESGCGKTVTGFSLMNLHPKNCRTGGKIFYHKEDGKSIDVLSVDSSGDDIRSLRGNDIAMIFQEPMASFSPVHTIGFQIREALQIHGLARKDNKEETRERILKLLADVGIPHPELRINSYPHELSGGLRQRAMIAMALSCEPHVLIADEPTTALDVTVQAQILQLIKEIQHKKNMTVIYITHDLAVISEVADIMAVMYLGRIVEYGNSREVMRNPRHPYTRALLASRPKLGSDQPLDAIPGTVPIPVNLPPGCTFYDRCPSRSDQCRSFDYSQSETENGFVSCMLYQ